MIVIPPFVIGVFHNLPPIANLRVPRLLILVNLSMTGIRQWHLELFIDDVTVSKIRSQRSNDDSMWKLRHKIHVLIGRVFNFLTSSISVRLIIIESEEVALLVSSPPFILSVLRLHGMQIIYNDL